MPVKTLEGTESFEDKRSVLGGTLRGMNIVDREPVELKHGLRTDYYVDVKRAYGDPKITEEIADLVWEQMDKKVTCIAAAGYGGLPLAVHISRKHGLHRTFVRDEPKKHGKGGWIDGYVPTKEDGVEVVDDVLTTAKSLDDVRKVIEATGAKILGYHVVVKRGESVAGPEATYLFKPEELMK